MMDSITLSWNLALRLVLSLACLAMIILTVQQVIARYAFAASSIWIQELQWHLFGFIFLMVGGQCLELNKHVRVDVLSSKE